MTVLCLAEDVAVLAVRFLVYTRKMTYERILIIPSRFNHIRIIRLITIQREQRNRFLVVTLREHLRTHETFTVDKIIRDIFRNYHQFSIKSYVVAIY